MPIQNSTNMPTMMPNPLSRYFLALVNANPFGDSLKTYATAWKGTRDKVQGTGKIQGTRHKVQERNKNKGTKAKEGPGRKDLKMLYE